MNTGTTTADNSAELAGSEEPLPRAEAASPFVDPEPEEAAARQGSPGDHTTAAQFEEEPHVVEAQPDEPQADDAPLDVGLDVGDEAPMGERTAGIDDSPPSTPAKTATRVLPGNSADFSPSPGAAASDNTATSAASSPEYADRTAEAMGAGYSAAAVPLAAMAESSSPAAATDEMLESPARSAACGKMLESPAHSAVCGNFVLERTPSHEVVSKGLVNSSAPVPAPAAASAPAPAPCEEADASSNKVVTVVVSEAMAAAPSEAITVVQSVDFGTVSASESQQVAVEAARRRADSVKSIPIGPPELLGGEATIYKLYRGTTGQIDGADVRVWVEFPALQICWAGYDLPARSYDRLSLLDLTSCQCSKYTRDTGAFWTSVEIRATTSSESSDSRDEPVLSITGPPGTLQDFAEALEQLLKAHKLEGRTGLEFIQKRLFQYLWRAKTTTRSKEDHLQAQAVLAFNLEPKEGVAYLKSKLGIGLGRSDGKTSEAEIGEWIAMMSSSQKGGLDPTLLGNYFSRKDTLEIFRAFVGCLDFRRIDIVVALRRLFDSFKPGGEGQVITRILEYFAEAYFEQWRSSKAEVWPASGENDTARMPRLAYGNPDTIMQVAVSLIMLNTGLHVAPKKVAKKACQPMTVEQYINNTRLVVGEDEVPEQALRQWYEAVRVDEISVEPIPRLFAFSKLPVQPDIEGWLIAVLSAHKQQRFWAVLALQRMYLFSDANDVEPGDVIDLKDVIVSTIAEDGASKDRFSSDLQRQQARGGGLGHICQCFAARDSPSFSDLQDAEIRAFEVTQRGSAEKPVILSKLSKPMSRIALVAENEGLREKWVNLIMAGPY